MAVPVDTFVNRLKTAMQVKGVKAIELAEKIGVNRGTISNYVNGKYAPKYDGIVKISKVLFVNPVWLMGYDVPMERQTSGLVEPPQDTVRIPLLGRVAAGEPLVNEGNTVGEIFVSPDMVKDDARLFALVVKGDSMSPKIQDKDVLICREQSCAEDGDIVIVTINGDEGVCKKFRRHKDYISLVSINQNYDALIFTKEDVEQLPVRIAGRVVQIRRDL